MKSISDGIVQFAFGHESHEDSSSNQSPLSLDRCQRDLWILKAEIQGYSILFRGLGEQSIEADSLNGVGLALERIYRKIEHINDSLDSLHKVLRSTPRPKRAEKFEKRTESKERRT